MATSAKAISAEECPECDGRIRTEGNETLCSKCGLILESDPVDPGPEWREFDDRDVNPRASRGRNANLHDKNLGSEIGSHSERSNRDHWRNRLNNQAKTDDRKASNRGYATTEIHRMGNALELSESVVDQAKHLFRQAHDNGLIRGRDLDTLAATCLYTISRVHQLGRSPNEFVAVASVRDAVDRSLLSRRHTWLCNELGVEVPPPSVETRVRVVGAESPAEPATAEKALELIDTLEDHEKGSYSPSTLAATAIYLAAGAQSGDYTQKEIANAAGVTPTSIRKRMELFEDS